MCHELAALLCMYAAIRYLKMRYRFITIFDSTWKWWYMKVLLTQSWTWFCVLTTLFKVLLLYLHTVPHMNLVHLAWDSSIRQYCFKSLCSSNPSNTLQVFDFWRIHQLLVFSHLVHCRGQSLRVVSSCDWQRNTLCTVRDTWLKNI